MADETSRGWFRKKTSDDDPGATDPPRSEERGADDAVTEGDAPVSEPGDRPSWFEALMAKSGEDVAPSAEPGPEPEPKDDDVSPAEAEPARGGLHRRRKRASEKPIVAETEPVEDPAEAPSLSRDSQFPWFAGPVESAEASRATATDDELFDLAPATSTPVPSTRAGSTEQESAAEPSATEEELSVPVVAAVPPSGGDDPPTEDEDEPGDRSRRRWVLVAAAAVVVLLFGLVAGLARAGIDRASDYAADFDSWRQDHGTALTTAAALPKDAYLVDDDAKGDASERSCAAIEDTRSELVSAADDLPTISTGPYRLVSAEYRAEVGRSQNRQAVLQTYLAGVDAAYGRIQRDCEWNAAYTKAFDESRSDDRVQELQRFTDPYGTEGPDSVCRNKAGCVSQDSGTRRQYAEAGRKLVQGYQAVAKDSFGAQGCGGTSYEDVCPVIEKALGRYYTARLHYFDVVGDATTVVNNPEFEQAASAYADAYDRAQKKIYAALVEAHPELASDPAIKKDPLATDRVMSILDTQALGSLAEQRDAVARM